MANVTRVTFAKSTAQRASWFQSSNLPRILKSSLGIHVPGRPGTGLAWARAKSKGNHENPLEYQWKSMDSIDIPGAPVWPNGCPWNINGIHRFSLLFRGVPGMIKMCKMNKMSKTSEGVKAVKVIHFLPDFRSLLGRIGR